MIFDLQQTLVSSTYLISSLCLLAVLNVRSMLFYKHTSKHTSSTPIIGMRSGHHIVPSVYTPSQYTAYHVLTPYRWLNVINNLYGAFTHSISFIHRQQYNCVNHMCNNLYTIHLYVYTYHVYSIVYIKRFFLVYINITYIAIYMS